MEKKCRKVSIKNKYFLNQEKHCDDETETFNLVIASSRRESLIFALQTFYKYVLASAGEGDRRGEGLTYHFLCTIGMYVFALNIEDLLSLS